MKRQIEYIFAEDLQPKTIWQKIQYFFGKRRKLEEHERIIEKPSNESLGIPDKEGYAKLVNEFLSDPNMTTLIYFCSEKNIGIQDLIESVRKVSPLITETGFFEARKRALENQYIFFDGVNHYTSPIGGKIIKMLDYKPQL